MIGFVLAPTRAQFVFLFLGQAHGDHVSLHGDPSLLTGRGLPEKGKIQVLKVDPSGHSFLERSQRWSDRLSLRVD